MEMIELITKVCGFALGLIYAYQMVYHVIGLFGRPIRYNKGQVHRLGILISARNEEHVISDLFESLKLQDYPADHIRVFVVADNCTDKTAAVARSYGAEVIERFNRQEIGKGYALDRLIGHIYAQGYQKDIDAFLIFDADNILEPDYLRKMNDCYASGELAITSYRNSKNMGDNWQSAGYSYGFIHDARYLNNVRNILGTSSAISGTGFLLCRSILDRFEGWPFHGLTEDTELTCWLVVYGYRVAYCHEAVLYDEQPTSFKQGWRQRKRWTKGSFTAFQEYGKSLLKRALHHNDWSAWDILVMTSPAQLLMSLIFAVNGLAVIVAALHPYLRMWPYLLIFVGHVLSYIFMFTGLGLLTLIKEWKRLPATSLVKVAGTLCYGLYMLFYPVIYSVSIFQNVTWKPIVHQKAKGIQSLNRD